MYIYLVLNFIYCAYCVVYFWQSLCATAHWGPWLPSRQRAALPLVLKHSGKIIQSAKGSHVVNKSSHHWFLDWDYSYPDSSWCWVGTDLIHWPKIPTPIGNWTSPQPAWRVQNIMFLKHGARIYFVSLFFFLKVLVQKYTFLSNSILTLSI